MPKQTLEKLQEAHKITLTRAWNVSNSKVNLLTFKKLQF